MTPAGESFRLGVRRIIQCLKFKGAHIRLEFRGEDYLIIEFSVYSAKFGGGGFDEIDVTVFRENDLHIFSTSFTKSPKGKWPYRDHKGRVIDIDYLRCSGIEEV